MLRITIPAAEFYDEVKGEFVYTKEQTLQLEHSLVSLSKWESKWQKSFLSRDDKTDEETLDYIRCMTLTQNVDPEVYTRLTNDNIREINEYISNPMTATFFSDEDSKKSREIITSELIYGWMIIHNIPSEYQKWHLNRLLTLIKVCERLTQPPKKMKKEELLARNAKLNAIRKQQLNTKG